MRDFPTSKACDLAGVPKSARPCAGSASDRVCSGQGPILDDGGGFEPGTWTLPTVPDTALQERGEEYWQAARDNPLIAGYCATRPHTVQA